MNGEFGFFDKDLFGNLVMELSSLWGYFGILVKVLCCVTAHWNNKERHFGKWGMEFGKVGENSCKFEMDICNLEGGHFGMWR